MENLTQPVEQQQVDTPTQTANPTADDVLGSIFDTPTDNTFTQPVEQTEASTQEQPSAGDMIAGEQTQQPQEQHQAENQTDNDQVRFQYWQSQAAKANNELNEVKQYLPMVEHLKNNPQLLNATQQNMSEPQQQEQEMTFPDPPSRPDQPRLFSREEAYSDPKSESAMYLDDVDKWNQDMLEYNNLKMEYTQAKYEEQINTITAQRQKEQQQQQALQQEAAQKNEIKNYVGANFNLDMAGNTEGSSDHFIQWASNPENLTIPNLVKLYKLQYGVQTPTEAPVQPSADFNQVKQAQQIPSPMGVMPSQGQTTASPEDQIMDALIADHNRQNPF